MLCFAFCSAHLSAQAQFLSGFVKDSLTQLPLSGATLSNSQSKQKVKTDSNGFFRLGVSPDDLLYALAPGYHYDTLRYSILFRDTITIMLSPVNVLQGVTVETGYARYQMDSANRLQEFEETRGQRLSAIDGSKHRQTFGLTLNLDRLFKNKHKNKRKEEEVFAALERDAYVRFRFSPQLVSFYTGLKGEALLTFLRKYTPSYEWLRSHVAREQLIDYLSEKLRHYRSENSRPAHEGNSKKD
jgi:hypothetical protein